MPISICRTDIIAMDSEIPGLKSETWATRMSTDGKGNCR